MSSQKNDFKFVLRNYARASGSIRKPYEVTLPHLTHRKSPWKFRILKRGQRVLTEDPQ
jgi:hypothetical protein